jgi:hypothetical protein
MFLRHYSCRKLTLKKRWKRIVWRKKSETQDQQNAITYTIKYAKRRVLNNERLKKKLFCCSTADNNQQQKQPAKKNYKREKEIKKICIKKVYDFTLFLFFSLMFSSDVFNISFFFIQYTLSQTMRERERKIAL